MRRATVTLAALALAVGGCGGADPSTQEEEPAGTGEETTLSPQELNDEETTGELPEKEPVRQDDEITAR